MRSSPVRRGLALAATISAVIAVVWSARASGQVPAGVLLAGSITGPSGEKMEGVIVSARAEGKSFTTSVYTDAGGEYYFPPMEPGKYKVWAQAVSFEAGRGDVSLGGTAVRQDFALKSMKDFEAQLPGDRWVHALPEDTPEDRRMKTVFRVSCGGCHSQNTALLSRFDERGWKNILTVMSRIATSGYVANALGGGVATEDMAPNPLIDYYKERLARYLAKVRGPGPSPAKFVPRPRPTGEAILAVIREYDTPGNGYGLPLWENGTDWSEGAPSKTNRQNHHAMDGTLDFEGNLFFTDDLNTNPYRSVGKIDWRTGRITNVKVPRRGNPRVAATVHDLVADQKGILWFGADGALIRLDPATLKWEAMTAPDGTAVPSGGFNAVDWKGGVWSATRGASRFDPVTRTFTQSRNPISKSKLGSVGTYGMAGDGDGNGWLAQFGIDIMVKHDPVTGQAENVQLPPSPNAPEPGLFTGDDRRIFDMMGGSLYQGHGHPWMHTVRKPGGGPDAVWGPGWTSDYLVKIDTRTLKVTLYPMPYRDVGNYQAVVDKDGMVWNVFTNADAVGKFDPKTEQWTWYDLPTRGTEAHGLQVVTVSGRVQLGVPYWGSSKMAKVEFITPEERQALKAAVQRVARGR
jgi:streptogramin lyase